MTVLRSFARYVPGLLLSLAVTGAALLLERAEIALAGSAWVEALVLAIMAGTVVRTIWTPPDHFHAGIRLSAHTLLEVAVALMGATISVGVLVKAGPALILGIVTTVVAAIALSFVLGRLLGLPGKMAVLVACGNAICGNSAIAAVAPAIDAESDDVATAIAFTAVLGVAVVIALPGIVHGLGLTPVAGGVLAGLTVYAVPQVLAAAAPMGPAAMQLGTLVKLVRVLMLGPVVAGLSLIQARRARDAREERQPFRITRFLPAFILIFLALMLARSLNLLSDAVVAPAHFASGLLTVVAMAGLGLGVDLRSVSAAGPRVVSVVTLSLLLLGVIALVVVKLCGLS